MNLTEIEEKLKALTTNPDKSNFIYDLLLAYGISKTSVTRLRNGDFNLSKVDGEVLYKNKILFKIANTTTLLAEVEDLAASERILKHNPRLVLVTDFKAVVAKDLKTKLNADFAFRDFPKFKNFFFPLSGAEIYKSSNDNKADRDAAYKLAELYDHLLADNIEIRSAGSHNLNIFLSRLLFCFFAEDTGIFTKESIFTETLVGNTLEDGSDTHIFLDLLFRRMRCQEGNFPDIIREEFPYVNGGLFRDDIRSPKFSAKTRKILLECGDLDWSEINPDIFGSMIQAVADPEERGNLGMHYTSVPNIKKLIEPLFLNQLYLEFEKSSDNSLQLHRLINRLSKIKFFDPACGSGNFLIITYKEIRLLEIKIIQRLIELDSIQNKRLMYFTSIRLSQFYGIEIKDFAHEMAVLSLWLAEHQMNKVFDITLDGYGQSKPILPLKEAGHIICENATTTVWETLCNCDANEEVYLIGNPPYLGYSKQDQTQKKDMAITFHGIKSYKKLDYISCWFFLAAKFMKSCICEYAFVTTNSITQGEQVSLLWPMIFKQGLEISFAHQSFKWENNAKRNAGVAVVIIGIRKVSSREKLLFNGNIKQIVKNISPYLTSTENLFVKPFRRSISNLPEMIIGSKISDNGNLILEQDEMEALVEQTSSNRQFIKKFIGAKEFMSGLQRYCIHFTPSLKDAAYDVPELRARFDKVQQFRLHSKKETTKRKASTPHLFDEDKYINADFTLVPQTGSEKRDYLPVGYFDGSYVPSNGTRLIYNSEPWIFGVVSSCMHIVWVKAVAGRLKTDMQYSNTLCYNTFPFPQLDNKQKETISQYVYQILDERAKYPEKTMAWLYNPRSMPSGLRNAHKDLDLAIDRLYRLNPFQNDAERLEYLFKMYESLTRQDSLFSKQPIKIKKTRKGDKL